MTPFARTFSIEHSADHPIPGDDTRRYGDTAITFIYARDPYRGLSGILRSGDARARGCSRSLAFADRVVVAVAVNTAKLPLFTLEERVQLIREAIQHPAVQVQAFDGLLVKFARQVGAEVSSCRDSGP